MHPGPELAKGLRRHLELRSFFLAVSSPGAGTWDITKKIDPVRRPNSAATTWVSPDNAAYHERIRHYY
jgi:hypothetical protein